MWPVVSEMSGQQQNERGQLTPILGLGVSTFPTRILGHLDPNALEIGISAHFARPGDEEQEEGKPTRWAAEH